MKKNMLFFALCLVSLVGAAIVSAQGFTGPVANNAQGQAVMISRIITINEARNLPHDSWVMLAGNIVNSLPGGRHYTLRDSSGEIAVDIGPKEWRGLSVDVSDRVEIYGEVKITRGQFSIKVHAITGTGRTTTRQGQAVTVNHPITINEALKLPHDSWVSLSGNIAAQLPEGKHNYSFRDASGEIAVDIGPKEWRGLSVGASDRIEIYGEVKNHRGQISIKVQAIRGINTAGLGFEKPALHPPTAATAASRRVLNPSFPHSLDHAHVSMVAISLRSSIRIL